MSGPFPISVGGSLYLATYIDRGSGYSKAAPIKAKSEAGSIIKAGINLVRKQMDCNVKRVRTDNGVSKELTDWFEKKGIVHETTTPHNPQHNPAERLNMTLAEKARAVLQESGLGDSYWAYAITGSTQQNTL